MKDLFDSTPSAADSSPSTPAKTIPPDSSPPTPTKTIPPDSSPATPTKTIPPDSSPATPTKTIPPDSSPDSSPATPDLPCSPSEMVPCPTALCPSSPETVPPNHLATTKKHLSLRLKADKAYRMNAERMQMKYCKAKHKKVQTFAPGDFVSVRIPRIDRSSTDFQRLPCIVVERLGTEFHLYRLRYACYKACIKVGLY